MSYPQLGSGFVMGRGIVAVHDYLHSYEMILPKQCLVTDHFCV